MQERSVLYLMGPKRILDRARQLPSMLARLPREIFSSAKRQAGGGAAAEAARELPDFPALLADQFTLLQTRIDDLLRSDPLSAEWMNEQYAATRIAPKIKGDTTLYIKGRVPFISGYAATKIAPASAAAIAMEEMESLRQWLSQRWNAQPRDTQLLLKFLKHLPGGEKLTQWSEAAPYLLTIIVATHHAFFGHIDLAILGGYSLVVWLTQRLSDEVGSRTRLANTTISQRFACLAHDQLGQTIRYIDARAAKRATIDRLERLAAELAEES
jgi:hypothetical protein